MRQRRYEFSKKTRSDVPTDIATFVAELRAAFSYDPTIGRLERIDGPTGPKPAHGVGSKNECGYYRRRFKGRKYYAHVLAWAHHYGEWPSGEIDHIDGNGSNNAIANLRVVDRTAQCWNRGVRADSATGVKGVCWDKQHRKYRVQLVANGKRVHQSLHADIDEARAAYERAVRAHHGEHGRT